ncbi:hypothetical protein DFH06DRAFT_1480724 [Mycena polygramma]|nr:hypothetical protein DFH06DRAFT_1480724 [Mycena polygramma]
MNYDTPLIHLYLPSSLDICLESMPVLTNTGTQNLTAQNERCLLSDTCRLQRPLGAAAIQRVRKRRRVDSHPRQQSDASFSSASTSILTSKSTVSSASRSASASASSRPASRSASSVHSASASASNALSSRSISVLRSSSVLTSKTLTSSSSISTHIASTSFFLSTVVVTATGSTTTITVAASSPALGTGESGGTPFSRNVGGIVGVAVGGVIALIVGAAVLFFTCKGVKCERRPEAEVELSTAPPASTQDQPAATEQPSATAASPRSSYHYTRATRPPMASPPPSSSSLAALISRLRGGRASTSSSMPGALESTTPLSLPMPAFAWGAQSQRTPGTPPPGSPGSPPPRPHTPGSLLNPRVHIPSSPPSPAPEWVGWRTEPPSPPPVLPPAQTQRDDPPRSPTGLLRPSLAVMQFESSRTLDDHEDYSRPIGGRVSARMESDLTVQSLERRERGGG